MRREFAGESNSAQEILPGLIGSDKAGFHVILIDPNGNKLKSWSEGAISAVHISTEYLKYLEHLKGNRKIPGCP